jgi:hypothetical protein
VKYKLTQHAKDSMADREIPLQWLERVLNSPERRLPDRRNPMLEHRLGVIDEFGARTRIMLTLGDTVMLPKDCQSLLLMSE